MISGQGLLVILAGVIQSHALMQKMLAAMIRQEAARMAHDNAIRKQQALRLRNARQNVSDVLNRK